MNLLTNIIEIGFSAGLFINAVLFFPQIIQLWQVKDSKGLSLTTFGGFSIIQIFAILHGIIHKDYILVMGYLVSLIMCSIITFLIVFYRVMNKRI